MIWALSITAITVRTNRHGTTGGVAHRTSCQLHIGASHMLTEATSLVMTGNRRSDSEKFHNMVLLESHRALVVRFTISGEHYGIESWKAITANWVSGQGGATCRYPLASGRRRRCSTAALSA